VNNTRLFENYVMLIGVEVPIFTNCNEYIKMKTVSHKWRNTLIGLTVSVLILAAVVVFFISPISKYFLEKYSEKYTGRKIKTDWLYLNPFTGFVHFSNLRVYEPKSNDVFFSAASLSVNVSLFKMIRKTYEITELTINKPWSNIIQNKKKEFNFNDLIERFTPKEKIDSLKEAIHFNIYNVMVTDGEIHFSDPQNHINYFIKNVYFESKGKSWDTDTINSKFSFKSGPATGDINGDITVNLKTLDYRTATVINKFDLKFFEQYLQDLANFGSFTANLDARIKAKGNFNDQLALKASGHTVINDFHLGKTPGDDYLSFEKLTADIIELNPKDKKYIFDSTILSHPYLKYERYDHLDNIQQMFGKKGANVKAAYNDPTRFNLILELADYIKVLAKNFLHSYYKVNKFAIYNGELKFSDYSILEKFSTNISPLYILADSIDKHNKRFKIAIKSGIKPYGNIAVDLSINPNDYEDFDMLYKLNNMPLTAFNPYLISYTSFPMERGTLEFTGKWNVQNGMIQSANHLLVVDPATSKRLKTKDAKWIPLPLIMAFIRERSNVIDYEIPVTGNLKDPTFNLTDVIIDLIENILIKPPTMPYIVHVRNEEREIEKAVRLQWEMRQTELRAEQGRFVKKMADFLKKNPETNIDVYPEQYAEKEKEYILFFEAKKKYFLLSKNSKDKFMNEEDSTTVEKMSVKDSAFVRFVNKWIGDNLLFTMQEKCTHFLDAGIVNTKFKQLESKRENAFISCFRDNATEKRVKIHQEKVVVPYNGFSFYKIDYKGGMPDKLLKEYKELDELNNEAPRKKYKNKRDKELVKK
jgi:hypothetical protein